EDGNETSIVRRLTCEVGISLLADEKNGLRRQRAAVRLDPAPNCADQRSGPNPNPFGPKGSVGHFQDDTAHILVGEAIVTGELHAMQDALGGEEEGIAAPAREEAVAAGLRYTCIPTGRYRRRFDDNLAAVAHPGSLRTLDAAQCRGLRPVPQRR